MTVKLDILKIRLRTGSIIALSVFCICMIFLLFNIYFSGIWHWIYVIAAISSMIGIIILPLIFPNYNVIGYIIIDNSKIRIVMNTSNAKEYPFNQIKQLRFELNETALDGGYYIRLGINNNIYITDFDNSIFKYKIKIESPSVVRFIDEKLDTLKDKFEVVKKRKGKIVKSLLIK
jgi:hypothetical protein